MGTLAPQLRKQSPHGTVLRHQIDQIWPLVEGGVDAGAELHGSERVAAIGHEGREHPDLNLQHLLPDFHHSLLFLRGGRLVFCCCGGRDLLEGFDSIGQGRPINLSGRILGEGLKWDVDGRPHGRQKRSTRGPCLHQIVASLHRVEAELHVLRLVLEGGEVFRKLLPWGRRGRREPRAFRRLALEHHEAQETRILGPNHTLLPAFGELQGEKHLRFHAELGALSDAARAGICGVKETRKTGELHWLHRSGRRLQPLQQPR
mmetsp:Transcript_61932/g.145151  ORF Transcript_61932/g.145151 Transcript_61932/m.145151 type:complete len:260 (-) Transcript_61932:2603-3382(-)